MWDVTHCVIFTMECETHLVLGYDGGVMLIEYVGNQGATLGEHFYLSIETQTNARNDMFGNYLLVNLQDKSIHLKMRAHR